MTPREAKTTIDRLFERIVREVAGDDQATVWLEKAYAACLADERQHRRNAWAETDRPRNSATTAARYFCVKWFLYPATVRDALEAASVRLDCLYASAVGLRFSKWHLDPGDFDAIDYAEHIAAPSRESAE